MSKVQARKTEWEDEYTLLCERCGYIIDDLDHTLPCPECGKPICESLPERRVGTPWQQKPSFKTMTRTWMYTLKHPFKTMDAFIFEEKDSTRLLHETISFSMVISLIFSSLMCFALSAHIGLSAVFLGFSIVPAIILALILIVLSAIEAKGLQVIGRARGFRISPSIAWVIVGHGAVGWLIVGLSVGVGTATRAVAFNIEQMTDNYALADDYRLFGNIAMVIGILAGFLFFETFAYLGLRRCKFANRPRPNPAPDQPSQP
jgi:predicted RNA-binding Zn-ribbon protein involved in translation (DUF1610 family)